MIIKMIYTVGIHKAVGVIVPADFRCKLDLRTERIHILHVFFITEDVIKRLVRDISPDLDILTEILSYIH